MKKTLLLLFGLLPLMLSAQLPKPPYTPQETIALMPTFPTLDGMLAYVLGNIDFNYTDEHFSADYKDNSDLSRFMTEYEAAAAAYKAAMDLYSEKLDAAVKKDAGAYSEALTGQSRQELGGMNVKEFQKKGSKEQEQIASASAYASAEAQLAQMGLQGIDVEKMSKMSEKEAEAYINQQMSASTGISEKEMAKMQKMSDKELEAYLSRPENKGKRETLEKMATGAGQIQTNVQASDAPAMTVEETLEMETITTEIGALWNQVSAMEDGAKKNAQMTWDSEYKARYKVQYDIMTDQVGMLEGPLSAAEKKIVNAKYDAARGEMKAIEKEYYRATIPVWRNTVVVILETISRDILSKTLRQQELNNKMNSIVPDQAFRYQSESAELARVMAVLQEYMDAGEKFSEYYIPL